ncbi:hydrolase [Luteimicrobium album]|uniref:Hydrolase n=1 Tax=Luteimicrobium album TaxID=1054550 RepID=A0ABQ6I565_9MICO|nr:isochorismatase family protein [Luteimicrobium album]GMA24930.1 hydrolase [Luteimicrobium album]
MPITTVDPRTALLVIDLQEGVAGAKTIHPVRDIAARAGELADAFRRHGQPVVLVAVTGSAPGRTDNGDASARAFPDGFADLLPELGWHHSDHTLAKNRWGAFHDTGLYEHLTALGVTQVVLAGLATSKGVESTARAAYDHGFHVTLATDAMTDFTESAHQHSLSSVFPDLGETGTVTEIITALTKS